MAIEFSVIVPIYNVEPYLRECVDSILAQTLPDFELILVDDGSPDNCPAICDEYARSDPRVTVIHQKNAGLSSARKAGLDAAQAEYICFVDSDDYIAPDMLAMLRRYIDDNGRPDLLTFGVTRVYEDRLVPRPVLFEPALYDKERLKAEIYPRMLCDSKLRPFPTPRIPGYVPTKVYRRSLVREHYVTDTNITVFEDIAMSYECLCYADTVYICEECPYFYRFREGSILQGYRPQNYRACRYCFDYIRGRIGGTRDFDRQINAFFTAETIWTIYAEFRVGRTFSQVLSHARTELRATDIAADLFFDGLTFKYWLYLSLLKLHAYFPLVLTARILFRGA